jgi:hypothetical protein
MVKLTRGSWIVVAVLLGLLALAAIIDAQEWNLDQTIQIPPYGYAAIVLGLFFSLAVGIGLMALIFYSSRHGYDEPAHRVGDDDGRSSNQRSGDSGDVDQSDKLTSEPRL